MELYESGELQEKLGLKNKWIKMNFLWVKLLN
jgi:hypothetical protein